MSKSCEVVFYEWEEECSFFTPGAVWVHGGEYYEIRYQAIIPALVEERIAREDSLDPLSTWLECLIREGNEQTN